MIVDMKRVAIVHDWFTVYAGSEKVVRQFLTIFPDADLYSLVDFLPARDRTLLDPPVIHTSFLQHAPFARRHYRSYLPLMPLAIERLDLSGYDLILSSCHAVAKGLTSSPDQLHLSYIHTPIRYAWDMEQEYLDTAGLRGLKGWLARLVLLYIRSWDARAAQRPDRLVANSEFVADRIWRTYRRRAQVIHPPVDTEYFVSRGPREDFYLAAGRLVPYKRMDLIAKAFQGMPDKQLVIIGEGDDVQRLTPLLGPNITWLGYQPDDVLRDHLQRCRAFVFAAREDFGILPLEAQACGAPVIAYGEGGSRETIDGVGHANPTGILFQEQTVSAIQEAVHEFERDRGRFDPRACRRKAENFSCRHFREKFGRFVHSTWEEFQSQNHQRTGG
jgi:glycosyltransferase involved in cell wall biosynthesis